MKILYKGTSVPLHFVVKIGINTILCLLRNLMKQMLVEKFSQRKYFDLGFPTKVEER